jgi:hypothetical protein
VASRGQHRRAGAHRGSTSGRAAGERERSGSGGRLHAASWHRLAGYGFALAVLATVVALLVAQTASAIHLPLLGNYGVAPSSGAGSGQ